MGRKYSNGITLAVLAVMVVVLAACAAGPNPAAPAVAEAVGAKPAGFWQGLWHGIILPFSFIVSLFNKAVGIFEIVNNGGWYRFGFVLGASIIFGGGGAGGYHAGRRKGC